MKLLSSVFLLTAFLFLSFGTASAEIKGTVMLPNLNVRDNSNFEVSITVSTDSLIGIAQFIVEYNSNLMTYVNSHLGADAPYGFSISNVNPSLPFNPTTPGTNENILIQVSGGGSKSFSGSDLEIVVIEFQLVGNSSDSSPLAFDKGASKTYLSTLKLFDIVGSGLKFVNGLTTSAGFSRDMDLSEATASFLGENAHDNAGRWVSIVGDANGDGYDDILIGASDNSESGKQAGQAYLIFGKSDRWTMDTKLSNADASFLGEDAYNIAGWHVSGAGDVNGDGYDDLLIGAPGFLDAANPGSAYLMLGKASGWSMDIDLADADVSLRGTNAGDKAGYCVSNAGDVNADGYDDFLVGAYSSSVNGSDAGQTYLILGEATGWQKDVEISSVAAASFLGEAEGDQSGIYVAPAGDVNGDGYDDFLIGAIGNDKAGTDAGQVYLFLGKPTTGWLKNINLSQADASFLGEAAGDNAGNAMAPAGDVNGDGYDDILIAAYYNGENGYLGGQVYLILGKPIGWHKNTPLSQSDASFLGEHIDDRAGKSVSTAGDLNDDGYDDLLIGAYGNNDGGENAGQAYLILGKATGWSMDFPLSQADASFWGENADDRAGRSVSGTGDVNGDGFNDILIGAYACDERGVDAGQVYLLLDDYLPAPTLTLTAPNGGENWTVGTVQNISWTSTGSLSNVKLEYSTNSGTNWTTIIASTANDGSELWTIPDAPSTNCLVRVTDTDGSPSDVSDSQFTISQMPFITITAPNCGEDWEAGTIHNITWTSQNTSGTVKLEYSADNGSVWKLIIASTADDGIFEWTIPNDPSATCLLKITDTDGSPTDQSNALFTISAVPSITVTAPNGGEDWEANSVHNITWTSNKTSGTVKIEYSTDNGLAWEQIVASTADNGSYSWTIPNDPSINCLVKITDSDGSPSDASDAIFTISQTPFITVVSPNGGEVWAPGTAQNIAWNSSKTSGTVKIEYSTDSGSCWKGIVAKTTDDGIYEWTISDDPSVNCLVRVADTDGTSSDQSDNVFTITQISHVLTMAVNPLSGGTTDPAPGDHNYPKGTVVNICATAATDYQFMNWTGDVADPNNDTTTVTMNNNKAVTANFSLIPITDLHASIVGETILLEWSPSLVATIYNVYRDTVYNFVPDTINGANRIGFHISDEGPNQTGVQWTDTGNGADIVGDVAKNYFYLVTAVAAVESAPSNVAGEFDCNLITTSGTDINEIVVIMNTQNSSVPITTAEELAQAIPNCSDVFYWDATIQGTVGYVKGLPFNNFAIYPGHPYMVNVTANTIWSLAGCYVDTSFNLITTDGTDFNHIGVPLSKVSLTTAELLGQDIPGCTDVYYWNAEVQGTIGHVVGLPFNNFMVQAGYPYYVNVTAPTTWPASGGSLLKANGSSPNKNDLIGGHIPHTAYGTLSQAAGADVKIDQLQIAAWIVGRPTEVLSTDKIGSGCDGSYWWIGVGNFATAWQVGDSLRVEIKDKTNKFCGTTLVVLTDAGSDPGGEIRLTESAHIAGIHLQQTPETFALNQNYPNPFNPETMISFQLPEARNVVLKIYNLLGDEIYTLIDEQKQAGSHQVIWNGKDNLGQEIPSGIYLVKIEAGDFRAYKKMIKIR